MENSQADKEKQQVWQQECKEGGEQVIQNRRNGDEDQFKQTANSKQGDNIDKNKKMVKLSLPTSIQTR